VDVFLKFTSSPSPFLLLLLLLLVLPLLLPRGLIPYSGKVLVLVFDLSSNANFVTPYSGCRAFAFGRILSIFQVFRILAQAFSNLSPLTVPPGGFCQL